MPYDLPTCDPDTIDPNIESKRVAKTTMSSGPLPEGLLAFLDPENLTRLRSLVEFAEETRFRSEAFSHDNTKREKDKLEANLKEERAEHAKTKQALTELEQGYILTREALGDEQQKLKQQKIEHARAVQDLEAEHAQAIEDLEDEHAQAVEGLTVGHAQAVKDLKNQHNQAVEDQRAGHALVVKNLNAEHTRVLADKTRTLAQKETEVDTLTGRLQRPTNGTGKFRYPYPYESDDNRTFLAPNYVLQKDGKIMYFK